MSVTSGVLTATQACAVAEAAERLIAAARTGTPCPPVRDLLGADGTLAYAVQQQVAAARITLGARVVGHKIGLTSPAVQRQLGVDRPDFGVLLDDMDATDLPEVPSERLLQPKAEAEIAFMLGADLNAGPLDAAQIRAAVAYTIAAVEIVDSRIRAWDISFADTVADNASSGLFVLGKRPVPLADLEPVSVQMTLWRDDELVSSGRGANCMGDPLAALAWLARTCLELGTPLRAGHVVLSGALGPMVTAPPGTSLRADLGPLGSVAVSFSGKDDT